MQDALEDIRKQVHEVRILCEPFELQLSAIEGQIAEIRGLLNERIGGVESRLLVHSFKLEQQALEIAGLLEKLEWVELELKAPPNATRPQSLPVREDKTGPELLPPQKPGT